MSMGLVSVNSITIRSKEIRRWWDRQMLFNILSHENKQVATYFPCRRRTSASYLDPPLWMHLILSFQLLVKSPTNSTSSPWSQCHVQRCKSTPSSYWMSRLYHEVSHWLEQMSSMPNNHSSVTFLYKKELTSLPLFQTKHTECVGLPSCLPFSTKAIRSQVAQTIAALHH